MFIPASHGRGNRQKLNGRQLLKSQGSTDRKESKVDTEFEVLSTLDLEPSEGEEIRAMARKANDVRGYLHIEIRRRPREVVVENRFWSVGVTNPEVVEAAGQPLSGLVDEVAGGVIAYVVGPESRTQTLVDALNAAHDLDPRA